jgi:hypothetical protein
VRSGGFFVLKGAKGDWQLACFPEAVVKLFIVILRDRSNILILFHHCCLFPGIMNSDSLD